MKIEKLFYSMQTKKKLKAKSFCDFFRYLFFYFLNAMR